MLACLLALLASAPQDPAPESPSSALLDALITKTNACEHFVAAYKIHKEDGTEGDLRLAFRAPDQGLFEMHAGKTALCQYLSGGSIVIHGRGDDGSAMTATITTPGVQNRISDSARTWLEESFPRKADAARSESRSGIVFRIAVDPDCEGLTINMGTGGGELLGWLQDLRKRPELVAAGSGAPAAELVFTPCEKARLVVAADTGFVSRLEKITPKGTNVRIQFVALDLEKPLDDAFFKPPPAEPGAKDMSAAYETMSTAMMFTQIRGDVYRALAKRVDEQLLAWNEEAQPKLRKLLQRVDEELVEAAHGPMVARLEEKVDSLGSSTEAKLAGASADQRRGMKAGAAKDRSGLQAQLQQLLEKLFTEKPPGLVCKLRPSLGEDLLALESPILREVFAEKITKPLLARYDEKVVKPLEGK